MRPQVPAELAPAYRVARNLHARYGRSYYLATRLLPADKRPHVHALYGFARYADDLVDSGAPGQLAAVRLAELRRSVEAPDQAATHPVVRALHATVRHCGLDSGLIGAFLDAMQADLSVTSYPSYEQLRGYMAGSAAAIGVLMLPILGTTGPPGIARPYAEDLGVAFQLTNFIRDVGEDLDRGRIYLPADEQAAFGVDPELLRRRVVDGRIRRLLAHQIARARELYRSAGLGIRLLEPSSRRCIRTAAALYAGILDEIERADYQVLDARVTLSRGRRARLLAHSVAVRG